MNWTSVAEIVSTIALVVGVSFAIIQIKYFRAAGSSAYRTSELAITRVTIVYY